MGAVQCLLFDLLTSLLTGFMLFAPYVLVVFPVMLLIPRLLEAYDELEGCSAPSEVYNTVFGCVFVICTAAYFLLACAYDYPDCALNFIFGLLR